MAKTWIQLLVFIVSVSSIPALLSAQQFTTIFEQDPDRNSTSEYDEIITFYEKLESAYGDQFQFRAAGQTDIGKPLHLGVVSKNGVFDPAEIRNQDKGVMFVNNGIHPGEPAGIDATMMWVRDLLEGKSPQQLDEDVVIVFIPVYNVGGALNRSSFSRANQNGPEAYGFRGNAKNLDLNRDFIKADSKNAQSFNQIYTKWMPQLFVDNHTSNGADYQYTLTLISTLSDRLSPPLNSYMDNELNPWIYDEMKRREWEMTPYVYARNSPDKGIYGFLDSPRYSSGYAATHHALSFIPETHMFKPYEDRVESLYQLMDALYEFAEENCQELVSNQQEAINYSSERDSADIHWNMKAGATDTLQFKGYEAKYKISEITGRDRLWYDRSDPYTKPVPYFNNYQPDVRVSIPEVYIIPQAYSSVIERLKWNKVELTRLERDTLLSVQMYYIDDYETTKRAYEGHYLHSNVTVRSVDMERQYYRGDFLVRTDQTASRYITEMLEPQGYDSFFAWNFFDGILQQKEYFSSYIFEDLALEILEENPGIKRDLEAVKSKDSALAASSRAQLDFIYKRSKYYEQTHNLYPVARIMEEW